MNKVISLFFVITLIVILPLQLKAQPLESSNQEFSEKEYKEFEEAHKQLFSKTFLESTNSAATCAALFDALSETMITNGATKDVSLIMANKAKSAMFDANFFASFHLKTGDETKHQSFTKNIYDKEYPKFIKLLEKDDINNNQKEIERALSKCLD